MLRVEIEMLRKAFVERSLTEKEYLGILQVLDEVIARDEMDQFGAKRCPFCGGEADMKPEGDYHEMTCRDCGVAKQGRTYEQALAEWNYRRP